MRTVSLASLKSGITRLRDKGGASAESLFDLLNGYVDASGAPTSRGGTVVDHKLPAGTKGLCSFDGKLHVFAIAAVDADSDDYIVDIVIHPDPDFAGTIKAIHFAKPFLGCLYVAVEFSDGLIRHHWLQSKNAWKANTVYLKDGMVQPTTKNGFFYTPTTQAKPATWKPSTVYAIGDVVAPTVYNGYQYELVEADGNTPASGANEPAWTASEGALVYDDVDVTDAYTQSTSNTDASSGTRYSNLPGYTP